MSPRVNGGMEHAFLSTSLANLPSPCSYDEADCPHDLIADKILADPQAHVDALVTAGVLNVTFGDSGRSVVYGVNPPHAHDWWPLSYRWDRLHGEFCVSWRCTGCPEKTELLPVDCPPT